MSLCVRHGVAFSCSDVRHGMPFVFQYGLDGDAEQTLALVPPSTGVREVILSIYNS